MREAKVLMGLIVKMPPCESFTLPIGHVHVQCDILIPQVAMKKTLAEFQLVSYIHGGCSCVACEFLLLRSFDLRYSSFCIGVDNMTVHGNSRFACDLLFCSFVDNMAARSRGFGFACRAICMISFSSVAVSSYHQISLQFRFATVCNVSLKPAWSSKLCVRKWVGISSHRAEGVGTTPRANVKSIHQESQGSGHIRLECTIWNPHEDEEDST